MGKRGKELGFWERKECNERRGFGVGRGRKEHLVDEGEMGWRRIVSKKERRKKGKVWGFW